MDELLKEFLTETAEHIDAAGAQLVALERDPSDSRIVANIFRLVHTIKGTCGFLGLPRLAHLAHAAETLIGRLRDGAPPTPEAVTLILGAIDRVKHIVAELEKTAQEPDGDDADLIVAIEASVKATSRPDTGGPATVPEQDLLPVRAQAQETEPGRRMDGVQAVRSAETIRVSVAALERMMTLVSELVLTRNQLLEMTRNRHDDIIAAPLQRLSTLTTDLQDGVMRARMQPVGRLFANLPRLVRELASNTHKKIDLVTEGSDTELDRQIIELIRDPLTHLIRNCADHGLETPDQRIAAGKKETGTIRVAATHEAGYITIQICDDGRGLNIARIRQKALQTGLADEDGLARMSAEDICRFIFAPGFSTAQAVTSISGRGVGMDVVRENIESIGGSVGLQTAAGAGTTFTLKIPLTLAIAPALIVRVGMHRFALPQNCVVEAVGISGEGGHVIDVVQGARVLRLRDEVLAIADLREILDLAAPQAAPDSALVVVMRVASMTFGIVVDAVADVQEIVVKPLGASLSHLSVFSANTILGDGAVVLILDPAGLAERLGLVAQTGFAAALPAPVAPRREQRTRMLIFHAGGPEPKALPLSVIARVEWVDRAHIGTSGALFVMPYRGRLIPLLPVSPRQSMDFVESQPILVIAVGGQPIALLVDQIVNIVEDDLDIQIGSVTPGVLGSAEIAGRATEFIDAAYFMQLARPDAYARGHDRRFRVLLVDDKLFFRDMLTPVLLTAGYEVISVASAAEALAVFDKGERFDAVVTDIDMPDIDGYALARTICAQQLMGTPRIVALVTHASSAVVRAASLSGMSAAVGKFDRAALLKSLRELLDDTLLTDTRIEAAIIAQEAA